MKFFLTFVLALLLLALESVLVEQLGLSLARLDITVVLLVFLGLNARQVDGPSQIKAATFTAFSIGYLLDVFSGNPTGLHIFLAVFVFLSARAFSSFFDAKSRLPFALACGAAAFGHGVLAFFFTWLTREGALSVVSLQGLPLQCGLCALAAALLLPLLRKIDTGSEPKGVLR